MITWGVFLNFSLPHLYGVGLVAVAQLVEPQFVELVVAGSSPVGHPQSMSAINFSTQLLNINSWTILHLPIDASAQLPSRGMIMVKGTMNGVPFKTLLEPDGVYGPGLKPSHWFRPDEQLLKEAHATVGDMVEISLEPTKEWIEPEVPEDLKKALASSPKAHELWEDITPMARWDWIRWVRAVKTEDTRKKHLDVMLDKLNKGMKRPCCFNRNMCSEPHVSKNWALLMPTI